MGFTITTLPGQDEFGAVVTGLTPDMLDDQGVRRALHDLWIDKGVVIFREMEGIDTQLRLSEIFGEPEEHPLLRGVDVPREHKLIIEFQYDARTGEGEVYEVDGEIRGGWLPWHFDLVYVAQINHGGILRPVVLPERGGETGYIDQIDAYNRLPEAVKAKIDDLEVVYLYGPIETSPWCSRDEVRYIKIGPANRSMNERAARDWPAVVHPMVFIQKETGRKALNLSPRFAQYVLGMDRAESDELLTMLSNHLWDSPAYFHKWALDEMVLWDNWRMLHCVTPGPYEEVRIVERTTIAGDYGFGRKLEQPAATA